MAEPQLNRINLPKEKYQGEPSTLCTGCGHDSITRSISDAYFEMGIVPSSIGKMSGIGCSSKTPAYFISPAFGFNSTHGRMPSYATGAGLANRNLNVVGVSGDGDTMSIGLGQFLHLCRRNLRMVYIIENNGTYGLTKGQFSATSDLGSPSKKGHKNEYPCLDPCILGISAGATFVARSFSGDRKQLVPLIKAAIAHQGIAVLDVISPCVTFNNHTGSTKSFTYVREHNELLQEVGFVPSFDETTADYEPGTVKEVELPDGSVITLKKLKHEEHDVTDRTKAVELLTKNMMEGHLLTGMFYVDPKSTPLADHMKMIDKPLAHITEKEIRPSKESFEKLMKQFY